MARCCEKVTSGCSLWTKAAAFALAAMLTSVASAQVCIVPDAGGTAAMPPQGPMCFGGPGYVSPDEVHMIIDGLDPGTTIELDANHFEFFGINRQQSGCLGAGSENESFMSQLQFVVTGTGDLAALNRTVGIPVQSVTCTGPRGGGPNQSFDTEMSSLQGQIQGDPDFDLLRITGGTNFGMPSPGHTTLVQMPGGDWAVDSFFDVFYRIDFVGAPGSMHPALVGRSGSTTGTIRMGIGVSGACCEAGTCSDVPGAPACSGTYLGDGTACTPGTACNDLCDDAVTLTAGGASHLANNTNATDQSTLACGTGVTDEVWYTVVGDGSSYTVTTCNPGTTYDTVVQVFCNDCASLFCVGGNDDATPDDPACHNTGQTFNRRSRFTWCTAPGQVYHIAVGGFFGATGDAETSVSSGAPCAPAAACSGGGGGDCCTAHATPGCDDPTVQDCVCALDSFCCAFEWDSICVGEVTSFGCGTCGGPVSGACCVGTICSDVAGAAACSGTYQGDGTFCSTTSCLPPPGNDLCEDATLVGVPSSTTESNLSATDDVTGLCGTSSSNKEIWYEVVGDGTTYTATTCNGVTLATDYDTKIQVWCGDCADLAALTCVDGNDDGGTEDCDIPGGANFESRISWCTQNGATYLLAVGAFGGGAGGTHTLVIASDGTSPCAGAVACLPPIGACCTAFGNTCTSNVLDTDCAAQGGLFFAGQSCVADGGTVICPTTGACCLKNGTCEDKDPDGGIAQRCQTACDVNALQDGTHGYGTCGNNPGGCCFADADGNGVVNTGDRGFISANIGQTDAEKRCLYDLDCNGVINTGDRGFVSANIGQCVDLPNCQMPGVFRGLGTECATENCDLKWVQGGIDDWVSRACPAGNAYDFSATPLPAGFFGPGSDPFTGIVQLGPNPPGPDTQMERLSKMVFDLENLPSVSSTPIQLVTLDLVGCAPITVTFNGGMNPQQWNVAVGLSATAVPDGLLTATKTQPNGGTFTSDFFVQPRFTFTKVLPPAATRTLDTGTAGIPPMHLGMDNPSPWAQGGPGGFSPGVDPNDPTCCPETCHSSFGQAAHEHCVLPPDCPECTEACCASDGTCTDVPLSQQCIGTPQGPDSTCATTVCGGACCDAGVCTDVATAAACAGDYQGNGTTCATTTCPSGNDECVGRTPIPNGANPLDLSAATTGAAGPAEPSCAMPFTPPDNMFNDLWYNYTATCSGTLFIDTCGGITTDTRLMVYDGCGVPCPNSPPLECNDDWGNTTEADTGHSCPDTFEASLSINVITGNCYKIRVGTFGTAPPATGGDFLNIECFVPPFGACCTGGGACTDTFAANCVGSFLGDGTTCAPINPCATGACCMGDGSCAALSEGDCAAAGGRYDGDGSTCATAVCDPSGACCNGLVCSVGFADTCTTDYLGDGTTCAGAPCEKGACCQAGGVCTTEKADDCAALAGDYQGDGTSCTFFSCAVGACCAPGGCTDGYEGDCAGTFQGPGTTCAGVICDNDLCASAIALTPPASDTRLTSTATDDQLPTCTTSQAFKERWYQVVGDGTSFRATTCNATTNFDTKIQVYCFDCDELMCAIGNDDGGAVSAGNPEICALLTGSNFKSRVNWCTTPGRLYTIVVGAFGSTTLPDDGSGAGNLLYRLDVSSQGACVAPNPTTPPACTVVTGSCCMGDATCVDGVTNAACTLAANSATAWSSTAACATRDCVGSCCLPDTTCVMTGAGGCAAQNGTFSLTGDCITAPPDCRGSCCLPDTSCAMVGSAGGCTALGGTFSLTGDCITAPPDCSGSCCLADGSCATTGTAAGCTAQGGGSFSLTGDCAGATPPDCIGSCCLLDGTCEMRGATGCPTSVGTFSLTGDCSTAVCTGACCTAGGCLGAQSPSACTAASGTYRGNGSACVANDACADATVVVDGLNTGNNAGTCLADEATATCQTSDAKDVWHTYTATCSGTVTMHTEGSTQPDTVLSVYTGTCGALTQIACDDDSGAVPALSSRLTFAGTATTVYTVRVASFGAAPAGGSYNLTISCAP